MRNKLLVVICVFICCTFFVVVGDSCTGNSTTQKTDNGNSTTQKTSNGISTAQKTDIHLTPENLVNSMFKAISEKDYAVLRDLCDPLGENDGDSRKICGMEYLEETEQNEMIEYFGKASINGSTTYETVDGDSYAHVPIIFGPNRDLKETIELVNRKGKWFFSSY